MTSFIRILPFLLFVPSAYAADYPLTFDDDGRTIIDGNTFCKGTCQPGDTITLEAGVTIDNLYIKDLHGTAEKPIIIRNSPGRQTHIDRKYQAGSPGYGWGILIQRSSDIILDGSNGYAEPKDSDTFLDPNRTYFGIKISRAKDKGLALNQGTEGIEIKYIEIERIGMDGGYQSKKGNPGIGIKNSNTMADDVIAVGQELSGFNYHHLYIHETATEAMYLGQTGKCSGPNCCNSKEDADNAVKMHGTFVHHVYTKNTGWDGISVGCDSNAQVYLNHVEDSGIGHFNVGTGQGICYGFNRGSGGKLYRNKGIRCAKSAIDYHGDFDILIENNMMAETNQWKDPKYSSGYGFKDNGYGTSQTITIKNNTFVDTASYPAVKLQSARKGLVEDNLYVNIGSSNNYGAAIHANSGIIKATVEECNFEDAANGNYDLTVNSPKDIIGVRKASKYPKFDLEGRSRTSSVHLGAYIYTGNVSSSSDGGATLSPPRDFSQAQ